MNPHRGDGTIGTIKKWSKIKWTNIKKEDPYKNLIFYKAMILMRAYLKIYFMEVLTIKSGMGSSYVLKCQKWRQEKANKS